MASTELGYLSGVTSNIQDQLNGKARNTRFSISQDEITTGGWKQILSWKNAGSFIVSIWNNYNYQMLNCATLLITTGYNGYGQIKLLNTASPSNTNSNQTIQNFGIIFINNKFTLNILLCDGFKNNLYIEIINDNYQSINLDYDDAPSFDTGLIQFIHNFNGAYNTVKTECAVYGDTLPPTGTNMYESGWYKGHIFFLRST